MGVISVDMSSNDLKSITDAYQKSLNIVSEPEMDLPEDSDTEIARKINAEAQKEAQLQTAIDTDIGNDASEGTNLLKVPIKDTVGSVQPLPESYFDYKLRLKRDALAADLARLRAKTVGVVDQNIQYLQEKQKYQGEQTYGSLIFSATRTTRSYLEGLKKSRRGKKAGRKGGELAP